MQSSVSYFCLNRAFRGAREYLRWQLPRARLLCREKWNHLVNLPCASLRKQWEASRLSRPRPRNQTCTSLALTSLLIKPHVTHVPASLFCVHMGTGITAGRMEGGGWQSRHRAGEQAPGAGSRIAFLVGEDRAGWAEPAGRPSPRPVAEEGRAPHPPASTLSSLGPPDAGPRRAHGRQAQAKQGGHHATWGEGCRASSLPALNPGHKEPTPRPRPVYFNHNSTVIVCWPERTPTQGQDGHVSAVLQMESPQICTSNMYEK